MTRQSFLATLFAPLLARFAPKAKTARPLPPGLHTFVELPAPVNALEVSGDRLFAFLGDGRVFEMVEDGTHEIGSPVDVADFEMAVSIREMTLEEFRLRYPA